MYVVDAQHVSSCHATVTPDAVQETTSVDHTRDTYLKLSPVAASLLSRTAVGISHSVQELEAAR